MSETWVYTCGIDHGTFLLNTKNLRVIYQNWNGTMECPCGKPMVRGPDGLAEMLTGTKESARGDAKGD